MWLFAIVTALCLHGTVHQDSDTYLHRVGRAGRFGTKGLAIAFVATDEDQEVLKKTQELSNTAPRPDPHPVNGKA